AFHKTGFKTGLARLVGMPRSNWGTALAHAGIGVTTLGIVGVTTFEQESVQRMAPGDMAQIAGYGIRFDSLEPGRGPNYVYDRANFTIFVDGVEDHAFSSEKRVYTASNTPTTEAGIETFGFTQVYVSVGDIEDNGARAVVRLWYKPLVTLIWIGTIFMTLGGLVSLSDRRLRIGAPKAATNRKTVQLPEPAE
ncbi:MAG: cytochrome c-type biogenesis CcmF C-terminal domain-containing protein, partial [Ahrensia sp.]